MRSLVVPRGARAEPPNPPAVRVCRTSCGMPSDRAAFPPAASPTDRNEREAENPCNSPRTRNSRPASQSEGVETPTAAALSWAHDLVPLRAK
jgi:hypothetical protein